MLASLTRALQRAYPIQDCVGHSDIATPPGRKTDPGPHFDWARFRGDARKAVTRDDVTVVTGKSKSLGKNRHFEA